jgi:capsule polysaccharide export protein KpsE/RkpR
MESVTLKLAERPKNLRIRHNFSILELLIYLILVYFYFWEGHRLKGPNNNYYL